jgi:D-serine deaminase-like pyridoxal phosphate-dependent protein
MTENWFEVNNPGEVLSPSLLVYKDRIAFNIDLMIKIAGDADRLVPHVKTHKMAEVIRMQLDAGINKFKCATLAEAELLAESGATWVLIAYQLVGPNIPRLQKLKAKYPQIQFSSLVDSQATAEDLSAQSDDSPSWVFLDINNGMNRSGHPVDGTLADLYQQIAALPNLNLEGLHVYDGHIRESHFEERKAHSDLAFEPVYALIDEIKIRDLPAPMVIAGGSPTFTVHAKRPGVYCSPGTCLLWDWGYGDRFLDQPFQHAALLATRVISKPTPGIVTVDLGHKAVAAENPIDRRFRFLNLEDYEVLSQSEEHGVLQVENWESLRVGDLFYAVPYHICPTVALHETVTVVENRTALDTWEVKARKRVISI